MAVFKVENGCKSIAVRRGSVTKKSVGKSFQKDSSSSQFDTLTNIAPGTRKKSLGAVLGGGPRG